MCLLSAHTLFLIFRYELNFLGCWTLLLQIMDTRTAWEDIVTHAYSKLFFQKSDDPKFWKKNAFFLWKMWPFSKMHNYILKRSKVFACMKYDLYESSWTFYIVFETLTWLKYIRHRIFSKQKKGEFYEILPWSKLCATCTSIIVVSYINLNSVLAICKCILIYLWHNYE